MSRVQWMMVAVALASFAAGIGVGLAAPAAAATLGEPEAMNPDQKFVKSFMAKFTARFDLRPDQVRDLRAILLQFYHDKVRIATSAGYQQWPAELRSQLIQRQHQMDERIRWILDEEQRALYHDLQEQDGK